MTGTRSVFSSGQQAVEIDIFWGAKRHGVFRQIGPNCLKKQLPSFLGQNKTLSYDTLSSEAACFSRIFIVVN
jgi:hypothetical protein